MILAAPHIIMPPERPALIRAADLTRLPSWQEMRRREHALREATFPLPMRPRQNATVALTDTTSDVTDSTSYSFGSRNIGAADPSRYVIAGVVGTGINGSTISSVTIGGIGATLVVERTNGAVDAAIYIAAVPTGTTATVVVNFSAQKGRAMLYLWRAIGLRSSTAAATASTATAVSNVLSVSLAVPAFGFAIGVAADNATTTTLTWSGLTKDGDVPSAEGATSSGASAVFSQQQAALAISFALNTSSIPALATASFR
jgi:hypothetical protein